MSHETCAPFALVLAFYERYRFMKLQQEDLTKIFEKYSKQPEKLLPDLKKKYNLTICDSILVSSVFRLLDVYSVPKQFADQTILQMQAGVHAKAIGIDCGLKNTARESWRRSDKVYDATVDVNSSTFNAAFALQSGKIIAPYSAAPLDSTFKFQSMITGAKQSSSQPLDRSLIDKAKAIISKLRDAHAFDTIAENSVIERTKKGQTRVDSIEGGNSPLAMLADLMKSKNRVQLMIRRKNGIKGILSGYVLAFDRHMNILLSDVLEAYVPNGTQVRACVSRYTTDFCTSAMQNA
jgi:small nuclear ribonucleoprotein (snRNP)-like protein